MKDFLLYTFIYTYKGVAYDEIYEKGNRGIPEAFLHSLKLALEASQRHSALFPLNPWELIPLHPAHFCSLSKYPSS